MSNELNFTAAVGEWAMAQENRLTAIFRESAQRLTSLAQHGGGGASPNGVPVDTGFARASIRASTESMPPIDPNMQNKTKATFPDTFGDITAVISNAQLGQHIYVGWTAAYINVLEYGHSQQAPAGFVRLAAAQWDQIVAQVSTEAKARVG